MPVSHIGLTVENLPASTSFFQSALQPLGYRYVGTRNDQIGFGVKEADFFLGPIPDYSETSPVHVAFAAVDRIAVRDFYAAALEAGGRPAGSPSYRGENNDIFNAAVLDLDGNTIEVVYHRGHSETASTVSQRSARSASTLRLQPQAEKERYREIDADNEATDSAVDLPRATSSIRRPSLPSRLRDRSGETPTTSVFGTMIGAAAGAAAIYAFYSMERDSAREEEAFNVRISRRHSSTDTKPGRSQYRTAYKSGSNNYRRHSEPVLDTSYIRPAQQKYIKNDRPSEPPLFRRSFTYNAPSAHHSHTLRRNKTYDTAINTIAEAPEHPEPRAPNQRSTTSATSHHSQRHNQDKNTDRPAGRHLERRSSSGHRRSRSQSHTSRRPSPPHRSHHNDTPANRPRPGSRYTAPLSSITAALGNDIPRRRRDDVDTVVPDDSISCVDLKPLGRRRDSAYSDRNRGGGGDERRERAVSAARRSGVARADGDGYDRVNDRRDGGKDRYDGYDRYHRNNDRYDRYFDTDRTGRRSSTVSLPSRPREMTRQYRYEIKARSRSREKSYGNAGGRRKGTKSLA